MPHFEIEPDIRKAATLPSRFYTDDLFFELSKEKIFVRTWQFAGSSDDVDTLLPIDLLPGFLDEPLLLSKNDGQLNCLSNVCTHRGKVLVEKACKAGLIRCGYHGRRFDLAGKFLSMPEFDSVENFPSEADNLRRVPVASYGGFAFVSVAPIAPFEAFVDGVNAMF